MWRPDPSFFLKEITINRSVPFSLIKTIAKTKRHGIIIVVKIDRIRKLIEKESYYFYTHALIEGKKDDISPEDILYCLLTGKIIERYPARKRVLVHGIISNDLPLHVVCDLSQKSILAIVTCYIPNEKEWIKYQMRKR